jgi:hypothetical protein
MPPSPYTEAPVYNMPGIYLAALVEHVTGVERLWTEEALGWFLLRSNAPPFIYRRYPPSAAEDRPELVVLDISAQARSQMHIEFLRSPTMANELKRLR